MSKKPNNRVAVFLALSMHRAKKGEKVGQMGALSFPEHVLRCLPQGKEAEPYLLD